MSWKHHDLQTEEHVADNYDLLYNSTFFSKYMYRSFVSKISKRIKLDRARVLELACGTSTITKLLQEEKPNWNYYCMDFSLKMLVNARKKCNAYFTRSDLENLPYSDDVFDVVYVHSAIHHFSSLFQIFYEVKRILKPGGMFLIQEPNESMNRNYLPTRIINSGFRKLGIKVYPDLSKLEGDQKPSDHHGKLDISEVLSALSQTDLSIEENRQLFYASAFFRNFQSCIPLALGKIIDWCFSLPQKRGGYMFFVSAKKSR